MMCWRVFLLKRDVKLQPANQGADVIVCLERGADDLHIVQHSADATATPSSLTSLKSRSIEPF